MFDMQRTKAQFPRLLELDRLIRSGSHPNCLTFAEQWEVSQKTVQRDIDFLRDQLGAPIEYDRNRKGFYYTDASWFLPALSLSEGDLFDLLVASRALEQYRGTPVARELERIFRKIAELMPEKISIRPELVFSRFSFTSPPSKPVNEKIWVTIVRGLQNQRVVKMKYGSFESGEVKERLLSPYHIANLQGEWYVFGPTVDTGEIRQFSLARIKSASLTNKPFDIPDTFDPGKMLQNTFGRFALGDHVQTVTLLFDKEIAPWVMERQWHPKQKVKKHKNGDIELTFKAAGLFEVFRWVLAWGHYVHVKGPAELKKWVRDEVKLMAKTHV